MPTPSDELDSLAEEANLGDNGAKARYGVAYVRAICSQAGVGFKETSPDEDVLAIDGDVKFDEGPVYVQVKCTSTFKISGRSASWPIEVEWREKWSRCKLPVYLVLVILDYDDRRDWIAHDNVGTHHKSAAFWVRVNALSPVSRVTIPKSDRLTVSTFPRWRADMLASFGSVGEGLTA